MRPTPRHLSQRLKFIVAAVAASMGIALAQPAVADTFPISDHNGQVMRHDGGDEWFCMYGSGDWAIPAIMQDNARAAANYLGNNTDAVTREHACDVSTADGDGMTDAVFEEIGTLGEGVAGQVWCNTATASGKCDRADVVLNKPEIDQYASNNENEYSHTACHELGHSVGLSHYPDITAPADNGGRNDCMRSGLHDTGHWHWTSYNDHHLAHINSVF